MDKQDYVSLIELADELDLLDNALIIITGFGHSEGRFKRLDNVYEILLRNSRFYNKDEDDLNDEFFVLLRDREKSSCERAELLMLV